MQRKRMWFLLCGAFVLMGLGWLLGITFGTKTREVGQPLRNTGAELRFVEPLLAVGNFEILRDFAPLQRELEKKIQEYKTEQKAKRVSIYYRNLESGRWMGINENEQYAPASMYKIALLITILKAAESNPAFFNMRLMWRGITASALEREPVPRLKVGQSYSIIELLEYLVVNSDNDAKNLLHTIVSPDARREIFTDLGLTPPKEDDIGDSLSAKAYSIFFRVLFNGTYLSPASSEAALELLSRPEFTEGLVAGIPKDISIAHKFGRRTFYNDKAPTSEELHDCGNVYLKTHPYFLCVMTEGNDDQILASIIAEISKVVYDYTMKEYR